MPTPAQAPVEVSGDLLVDFISGKSVRATPEEREAVQVFAHRLVEDFNYPKDVILEDQRVGWCLAWAAGPVT